MGIFIKKLENPSSSKNMEKRKMTTPKREDIIERAFAIHHKRNHNVSSINPEVSELKESGAYQRAKCELMRSEDNEYVSHIEREARRLKLIDEKVETENPQSFTIDLDEVMKTGIAITGTSHSGKSNLGFVVADMLMKNGVTVFVVDPSQTWMQNSSIPNVVSVMWNRQITWQDGTAAQSTVFDVSRLTVLQQKWFVEKFCKTIFEHRVRLTYRPATFIFFEEAHLFFPEGSMRSKGYQEALRIITVGRNFRIRFGLVTQWSALIDKTVLKFPRQKWFGYTDEKNDKEYLRNFIGKRVDELETLGVGQFIYDYGKTTEKVQVPLFEKVIV